MNTELKSRKNKIKKIYKSIIDTGYLGDDPIELNYNHILTDLYAVNNLINNTFLIFKDENISDETKAEKLLELRDHKNKKLVTNIEDARKIVSKNKEPLLLFFNKIKAKQKENTSQIIQQKIQRGGANKRKKNADLDIDDILKNIERVTLEKSKKFQNNIENNPDYLADLVTEIPEDALQNNPTGYSKKFEIISDWIFHPLWKLENMPVWGSLIEVPIDLVDIVLNNCILIVESVYPIISLILSTTGTTAVSAAVAAIPVVGPMLAGSAWENLVQPFLDWIIPNFLKIVAFFLNIWRRDLPSAYVNALDFIPFMENTMHVLSGFLLKINKYIDMVYPITNTVRSYTEISSNLALTLLLNPNAFTDLEKFYIEVIKPNQQKIPIIKDLPKELLEKDKLILSIVYETIHDITKCVRKALNSKSISACIEDFKLENIRNKLTAKLKNELSKK